MRLIVLKDIMICSLKNYLIFLGGLGPNRRDFIEAIALLFLRMGEHLMIVSRNEKKYVVAS